MKQTSVECRTPAAYPQTKMDDLFAELKPDIEVWPNLG